MIEHVKQSKTPEGIPIYLELWDRNGNKEYQIGAYPIAQNGFGVIYRNEPFRLTIASLPEAMNYAEEFEKLENGTTKLSDYKEYFWNGIKDKWFLDIATEEEREQGAKMSASNCAYFHVGKHMYNSYGLDYYKAEAIWNSTAR